jgi:hypothetical protein
MYNDADVEALSERLRSPDSAARAVAADEATDGVSAWGYHTYTEPQARRITKALVNALAVESDDTARESIVNALAALVAWDLAPGDEVSRAVAIPRPANDPIEEYWMDIEEWASRQEPPG